MLSVTAIRSFALGLTLFLYSAAQLECAPTELAHCLNGLSASAAASAADCHDTKIEAHVDDKHENASRCCNSVGLQSCNTDIAGKNPYVMIAGLTKNAPAKFAVLSVPQTPQHFNSQSGVPVIAFAQSLSLHARWTPVSLKNLQRT